MNEDFSFYNIISVVIAYILGSIPTAVWVSKAFYGLDIREHGSRNAGATNTFRVLGKKAGIPVLLVDMLKGFIAVKLAAVFSGYETDTNPIINFKIVVGLAAVLGHIFPVFAEFKGGKGVATLFGVILAMHWQSALSCLGIFTVVFLLSRYVSLGAMVTAVCFPFLVFWVFKTQSTSLIYFSMVIAVLILITHQKNIERLVKRQENRMNIKLRVRNKNFN